MLGSPPEVLFTLTDQHGNAIVGLENFYSLTAGAALPTQRTIAGTITKLVPGTNGSPSKWVSYMVANVDITKTTARSRASGLRTPTRTAR